MLSHLPEIIQPGCKHRQPQPRTPALKHSSIFPLLLRSFLGSFCIFIGLVHFSSVICMFEPYFFIGIFFPFSCIILYILNMFNSNFPDSSACFFILCLV